MGKIQPTLFSFGKGKKPEAADADKKKTAQPAASEPQVEKETAPEKATATKQEKANAGAKKEKATITEQEVKPTAAASKKEKANSDDTKQKKTTVVQAQKKAVVEVNEVDDDVQVVVPVADLRVSMTTNKTILGSLMSAQRQKQKDSAVAGNTSSSMDGAKGGTTTKSSTAASGAVSGVALDATLDTLGAWGTTPCASEDVLLRAEEVEEKRRKAALAAITEAESKPVPAAPKARGRPKKSVVAATDKKPPSAPSSLIRLPSQQIVSAGCGATEYMQLVRLNQQRDVERTRSRLQNNVRKTADDLPANLKGLVKQLRGNATADDGEEEKSNSSSAFSHLLDMPPVLQQLWGASTATNVASSSSASTSNRRKTEASTELHIGQHCAGRSCYEEEDDEDDDVQLLTKAPVSEMERLQKQEAAFFEKLVDAAWSVAFEVPSIQLETQRKRCIPILALECAKYVRTCYHRTVMMVQAQQQLAMAKAAGRASLLSSADISTLNEVQCMPWTQLYPAPFFTAGGCSLTVGYHRLRRWIETWTSTRQDSESDYSDSSSDLSSDSSDDDDEDDKKPSPLKLSRKEQIEELRRKLFPALDIAAVEQCSKDEAAMKRALDLIANSTGDTTSVVATSAEEQQSLERLASSGAYIIQDGALVSARLVKKEETRLRLEAEEERKLTKIKGYLAGGKPTSGAFSNIALIQGPVGVGKTHLVYRAAEATGCRVTEINTSIKRNSKCIENAFVEATKTKQLDTSATTSAEKLLASVNTAGFASPIEDDDEVQIQDKTTKKNKGGTTPVKADSSNAKKSSAKDSGGPKKKTGASGAKKGGTTLGTGGHGSILKFFAKKKPAAASVTPQKEAAAASNKEPVPMSAKKEEVTIDLNTPTETPTATVSLPRPNSHTMEVINVVEDRSNSVQLVVPGSPAKQEQKATDGVKSERSASLQAKGRGDGKDVAILVTDGSSSAESFKTVSGSLPIVVSSEGPSPVATRPRLSDLSATVVHSPKFCFTTKVDDLASPMSVMGDNGSGGGDAVANTSKLPPPTAVVVLIESGNELFDDEVGMYSAIRKMAQTSKVPVIVTSDGNMSESEIESAFGPGVPEMVVHEPKLLHVMLQLLCIMIARSSLYCQPQQQREVAAVAGGGGGENDQSAETDRTTLEMSADWRFSDANTQRLLFKGLLQCGLPPTQSWDLFGAASTLRGYLSRLPHQWSDLRSVLGSMQLQCTLLGCTMEGGFADQLQARSAGTSAQDQTPLFLPSVRQKRSRDVETLDDQHLDDADQAGPTVSLAKAGLKSTVRRAVVQERRQTVLAESQLHEQTENDLVSKEVLKLHKTICGPYRPGDGTNSLPWTAPFMPFRLMSEVEDDAAPNTVTGGESWAGRHAQVSTAGGNSSSAFFPAVVDAIQEEEDNLGDQRERALNWLHVQPGGKKRKSVWGATRGAEALADARVLIRPLTMKTGDGAQPTAE